MARAPVHYDLKRGVEADVANEAVLCMHHLRHTPPEVIVSHLGGRGGDGEARGAAEGAAEGEGGRVRVRVEASHTSLVEAAWTGSS